MHKARPKPGSVKDRKGNEERAFTRSAIAEGVAAVETVMVVKYLGIDGVTERGSSGAAGRATDEATENGSGNATERSTDRAGKHADRRASFCAGDGHGDAAGSAS
ncbi:hypothetical protein ACQUJS_10850 [Ralstonia pseudosolanacearum]